MNIPDPKTVISLAQELEEARARCDALQERWNQMFTVTVGPVRPHEPNMQQRIEEVLNGNPDRVFRAEDVANLMSAKASSVSSVLSRLVSEGRVEKHGRGSYGALTRATLPMPVPKDDEGSAPHVWNAEPKEGVA